MTAKQLLDWYVTELMQMSVSVFMADGHLARHVRKMRRVHAGRRATLITQLGGMLSDWVTPLPSPTGIHLAASFKKDLSYTAVTAAAEAAGIKVRAIPGAITFGYGAIESGRIQAINLAKKQA